MIRATYSSFKAFFPISIYSQQLKIDQLTNNLQKIMISSVSNDANQWTRTFGPDFVTITVNDLVQNITISSQEIPLAAWQLQLAQRQNFLDSHLPRVPTSTQNQEGTREMRDEVLSSVGTQDLDTSSYLVSDLEDIELNWENSILEMDAVFRRGIDTPFLQQILTIHLWKDQFKNPLVWTKKKIRRTSSYCSINIRVCQTH